jgi:hypothetical protein
MWREPSIREARKFGVVVAALLVVLAGVQAVRGHPARALWFGGSSVCVLALTMCVPRAVGLVLTVLTPLARAIGWVNTRVLLAVTFYLVFAPVGLVARLLRKDLLKQRFRSPQDSYWIPCEPKSFNREDYTKQF